MTEEDEVVREGIVCSIVRRDEAGAEALPHATETGLVNPIREVVFVSNRNPLISR
jgi:hypothetical protein